jgi:hypothetical protein
METFLTEQEYKDIEAGKATPATIEKVKPLTTTQYVPITRLNDVLKEKKVIEEQAQTTSTKLTEIEKTHKAEVDRITEEITKKSELEVVAKVSEYDKKILELTKVAEDSKAVAEQMKKGSDAYQQFHNITVEESKKILGSKWQEQFGHMELIPLQKLVQDMTGKPLATIFTPPQGKGGSHDTPLTPREMIVQGLQEKTK